MHAQKRVSAYVEALPEEAAAICISIRQLIAACVPDAEERFSFGIPFYHYFGMFCYLNYRKKEGGTELAFCRGKDLLPAFPELQLNGRTMVAGITFFSSQQMDISFLRQLILSAADWQREAKRAGKPFVKTAKKKGP